MKELWIDHKVIPGVQHLTVFKRMDDPGVLEVKGRVGLEYVFPKYPEERWVVICLSWCTYHNVKDKFDEQYLPLIIEYLVNEGVNSIRVHR